VTTSPADLHKLLAEPGAQSLDCAGCPRLPTDFIIKAVKRPAPLSLINTGQDLNWALTLLGLTGTFAVTPRDTLQARDLPFQVGLEADATVLVSVDRAVANNKLLYESASHSWGRGLLATQVVVDFAAVDFVNSVLVAWLLQLAQATKPAAMTVRNARSSIVTQFKQLRLDQMMTIA
jgi:hypothetical protein